MSVEQAPPHVDLHLPTPGLDTSAAPSHAQDLKMDFEPVLPKQTPVQSDNGISDNASATQNTTNTVIACEIQTAAQQAMSAVRDHPTTQNVKDTVVNGPVGQTVSDQSAKTSSEFKDLANSRTTPDTPAATDYHSMFYRLLSWKNPRATAITFALNIAFIFAGRYLNVVRYAFKALYMIFGITAAAEILGKTLLGDGLATRMRPRKYFTIPKESLERLLDDVEQFINFFVIEFQRILFAENIWVTGLAFISAFASYFLIKFVPLWGLTLISTLALYLGPLIYVQNKEVIDAQLKNAGDMVSQQSKQIKDMAAQHTKGATETISTYAGEYTKKAQDMVGQSRQKIPEVVSTNGSTSTNNKGAADTKAQDTAGQARQKISEVVGTNGTTSTPKAHDFPSVPQQQPIAGTQFAQQQSITSAQFPHEHPIASAQIPKPQPEAILE
ncbi:Reticulon-domain-containing protein [Venturia nashicola]|uniref:Reticulon-like protein n=1 Tax=Venturia nashicola TaxID=86259 RepID=A0A4Z1NKY9_9PEZI|nr:Reticulon-domain-containing protein [Venturia nashicola]